MSVRPMGVRRAPTQPTSVGKPFFTLTQGSGTRCSTMVSEIDKLEGKMREIERACNATKICSSLHPTETISTVVVQGLPPSSFPPSPPPPSPAIGAPVGETVKDSSQSSKKPTYIFACNQHTNLSQVQRDSWVWRGDVDRICLAMPHFNYPKANVILPARCVWYNIPVFGLRISNAIISLFEIEEVKKTAEGLGLLMPQYGINTVVQEKMKKVHRLIDEANKREDCLGDSALAKQNQSAIGKLERFVSEFEKLETSHITSKKAWVDWVNQRAEADWINKQHINDLLSNFGFHENTASEIKNTKIADGRDADGNMYMVTLGEYSLRWLSKAFAGYNMNGCLTDVANLLFAMAGDPPAHILTEQDVIDTVEQMVDKIKSKDLTDIWIPTHLIHDAEVDDLLTWVLLTYLNKLESSSLKATSHAPILSDAHCIESHIPPAADRSPCRRPS